MSFKTDMLCGKWFIEKATTKNDIFRKSSGRLY